MKPRWAVRRQEAESDARKGAQRARAQDGHASKSQTADLFAAADAVFVPSSKPSKPRLSRHAGGMPPIPQPAGSPRPRQLWYAVIFPELIGAEHSAAVLQRLCLHAQAFTSFVSIDPPNALLLEIRGSLKLLGPLAHLHANLDACWRRLALKAQSATAPSTLAALWFARAGELMAGHPVIVEDFAALPGQMAKLPLACICWDAEHLQTLRSMGVTRVGELLRLPRTGIARRFGTARVQDLDMALGRQAAPRRAFVPRERFRERCDFETEIEHVAYLEKALEPLIARCALFLRERQAGVQALRLKLRHREGPATRVQLGLASVTGERRRLTDVLIQKLERLELSAPVRGMELISGCLQPLSAGSLDAFAGLAGTGAGRGRDSVPQLVERLRARLGDEAVYGVRSIAEHRPEAAWRRVHDLRLLLQGNRTAAQEASERDMPRPVWLLDEPALLPHQPVQLLKDGWILEQGPERIESGWWDGRGVARDYYIARHGQGARLWIFRERQSKRWYLHGMFA
jgi:protein ImuB